MLPSLDVLDLFAVPHDARPIEGGQGRSVVAGDLVLSPGREEATQAWLSPVLARLAVGLDEHPRRRPRDLRVALPVPARSGSWVVQGWSASRFEPGTTTCRDVEVIVATGRLLHAQLATAVPERPAPLDLRDDRWAEAERAAFGDRDAVGLEAAIRGRLTGVWLGPDQLVHADLAGNVLLDASGAPLVIDLAPSWRPARWAEAVAVLDEVLWGDASWALLGRWRTGADREAMLRALLFRLLSDDPADEDRYAEALRAVA